MISVTVTDQELRLAPNPALVPLLVMVLHAGCKSAKYTPLGKFGGEDAEDNAMYLQYMQEEHQAKLEILNKLTEGLKTTGTMAIPKEDIIGVIQTINYLRIFIGDKSNITEEHLHPDYAPKTASEAQVLTTLNLLSMLNFFIMDNSK